MSMIFGGKRFFGLLTRMKAAWFFLKIMVLFDEYWLKGEARLFLST